MGLSYLKSMDMKRPGGGVLSKGTQGAELKAVRPPAPVKADPQDDLDVPSILTAQIGAALRKGAQVAKEAAQSTVQAEIDRINKRFFLSRESGNVRIYSEDWDHELNRKALSTLTLTDFKALLADRICCITDTGGNTRRVAASDAWLRSPDRRAYLEGMALLPGGVTPEGVYNLWQGWGVISKAGDVSMSIAFIRDVICDGAEQLFHYVIRWLAWGVQNPAKQSEVALVLQGKKGTGKGTLGRWMLDIFGAHGLHILQRKHLVGNFNAHLRACCFAFADEAFFAGDREGQAVLKGIITEDQITIERKGVDAYSVRNRLKVMMATNEKWVVPASEDERRYCVVEVSDIHRGDHEYFGRLDQHMRAGGLEAFFDYLLALDLTGFNIRAVPNTEALEQQKLMSLPPFKRWLYDRLYEGRIAQCDVEWKHPQSREQVVSEFEAFVELNNLRHVDTSARALGAELRELFPTLGETREGSGTRRRLWILPDLADARRQFAENVGLEFTAWPEDVE